MSLIQLSNNASAPGTPNTGKTRVYTKSDKRAYYKDDAGSEFEIARKSEVLSNTILTTKGDLLTRDASTHVRLPVGADGFILQADSAQPSGIKWAATGGGDVFGPGSATDNAITRFDGATGKFIQNSAATIDDSGNIATPGTVDGRDVSADGATLDAHVANLSNPHVVTAAQVGNTTAQWNANQLQGTNVSASAPSAGNLLQLVGGVWTPQNPTRTRSLFFNANFDTNRGDFRVRRVNTNGTFQYTFFVPADFLTLSSLQAIVIPSAGAALGGRNIDLFSDYAAIGEPSNNHDESNTAIVFNLAGTSGQIAALDISSVFSSLSALDFCGITIIHNAIGGDLDYLGIRLTYTASVV